MESFYGDTAFKVGEAFGRQTAGEDRVASQIFVTSQRAGEENVAKP